MAWQYHPQEIVWRPRGLSGGARRLAERLHRERPTAWVGHGAHFGTDTPSEGPATLTCSGRETRWLRSGHPDLAMQRSLLRDVDLAVVEGRVDSAGPWVVELDESGLGLEEIPLQDRSRVAALVGDAFPRADVPPGGIPRFGHAEHAELADHLLDMLESSGHQRPLVGLLLASSDAPAEHVALARTALESRCGLVLDSDNPDIASRHPRWQQAGLLLGAMELHPEAAIATLEPTVEAIARWEHLLDARDPLAEATAYRARESHMPSPACAVWEPRARGRLFGMLSVDVACLRRTLVACGTKLLDGI